MLKDLKYIRDQLEPLIGTQLQVPYAERLDNLVWACSVQLLKIKGHAERAMDALERLEEAAKEPHPLVAVIKRMRALEIPFAPISEGGLGLDYLMENVTFEAEQARQRERIALMLNAIKENS